MWCGDVWCCVVLCDVVWVCGVVCGQLPPAPFHTQFSNISLETTAGPVPLALAVTPVTEPFCSLSVTVDNAAAVTTFQGADD